MNNQPTPLVPPARVTYTRRFFGDNILEGVLMVVTLFVGWLIWLYFASQKGQTPAKQLLNVRVLDNATGRLASQGQVWKREVLGKLAIPVVGGIILFLIGGEDLSNLANFYTLIGGISILADSNDRAIWDKFADTRVGYFPNGLDVPAEGGMPVGGGNSPSQQLLELEAQLQAGTITDDQYQRRREEILRSI